MQLSRRDLLKVGLFSSAALMLPAERVARTQLAIANRMPESALPEPFTLPFAKPPVLAPFAQSLDTDYYLIEQRVQELPILGPGKPATTIWGYNGITPGPTIVANRNRKTVVRQINRLPEQHPAWDYPVWTSTHLHGSASLPEYDGYASDITTPGFGKDYHYPQIQDARTLWYHDHGVHHTAENAYMGLAAMYILHDQHELSLPIPHGEYDVPLILKDAMFDSNGELVPDTHSDSGIYGDVILVNGVPWPNMEVEPRKYRFRVLNASVSRSYDLSLSNGEPLTVIGTDGGLMPHPAPCGNVKVGMAERYEIVIDFSKYSGKRVVLENTSPKNNIDYDTTNVVMAFTVKDHATSLANNEIPQDLNPNMSVMGLTERDASVTRNMRFERGDGHWTVNGQTWEDIVNSDYNDVCATVKPNAVEIWELDNPGGGWFHPVHIHLVDFKILDRNGESPEPWEAGPKDVAYVGENEVVRVIMRFEHQEGKYMMHCHNLVHEDHDMMTQFQVGDATRDVDLHDPIEADKCKEVGKLGELYTFPRDDDDNSGHGKGGGGGISVPAAIPAAPAPAAAAPQVKVLGSVKKSKPKRKVKKVKLKAKPKRKVTTKKTKVKAKPKAGARKSPSKRALRSRRISGGGRG
jgi:spore coat protein A